MRRPMFLDVCHMKWCDGVMVRNSVEGVILRARAVIVEAVRTPIGKSGGMLWGWASPADWESRRCLNVSRGKCVGVECGGARGERRGGHGERRGARGACCKMEVPVRLRIEEAFFAQASRTPERWALADPGGRIRYRELARIS